MLLGTDPNKHSLLFASLQQLIDSIRDVQSPPDIDKHLENIQTKVYLTSKEEQVCYPKSELEHVSKERKTYEIIFDSSLPPIKFSLPLPQMITEWGLAQLILRFKLSEVINVLMLLLIEQSVLIIGHSREEVSACTLALKALLQPYSWPNVIIPSLPQDIMDVVSSPVPYIVGIVAASEESIKEIENDMRVKAHMDEGLTVINLTSWKISWTTSSEIHKHKLMHGDKIISYGFEIFGTNTYRERLKCLAKDESSSLNSFKNFFIHGPSAKESVTLNSIKKLVSNRLSQLSGMLSKSSQGWQLYGVKDSSRNVYFSPQKFYAPVQSVLEFERMFSQTQILSCYFEEKKNAFMEIDQGMKFSLFVADWVYFHWWKYQKLKRNKFS